MSSDSHGADRRDGHTAVQPSLAEGRPADRYNAHPTTRARPGAYRIGLFALATGLMIIVLALATRVTSIVQTILLAVPLALVGIGLERIGRGEGKASLRAVGWILLMVAVVGSAVVSLSSPNRIVLDRLSAPAPSGTNQALLRATPGSGQLRVGPEMDGLYAAELRGQGRPSAQVTADGKRAVLDLRAPFPRGLLARNRGSDWAISLGTGLPWQVEVEAGTISAELNLRQLDVRGVRVESGTSRLVVGLGAPAAEVPINLQVSSGLVDIYLPRTAACEIRVDGISIDNFRQEGLVKDGGVWRTTDTAQAGRYILNVRISGGRVRVHRE